VALLGVAVVAALSGTGGAAASGSHALIQGSGSSWAANAVNQWVADVASQGMQVVFTANGSALGRKDYANRATDFGVSDVGFLGADPKSGQSDTSLGRSFAYLPVAAGGTSLPYHIDVGNTRIRNLRLSGETVAKIFTGQITNWNDAAITKDNNGRALPSLPIIPVVHAEGAGVTMQFTRYLAKQYPQIWAPCNGGSATETEYFPVNCGKSTGNEKAFSGSDGVMNFLKSSGANGSIGLEEYSYPLLSNYPAAKLLNRAGFYTLPTQYNVAVALTKAVINEDASSPNYLLQDLDDVYTNADRRTYPLSSYVYAIIPTASNDSRMTTAKRQTLADFLYYSICQGQQEIGPIGYSSLPINLVQAGFEQIGKLKTADPGVDLTHRDVSTCHNPTFIAGQPRANHLAVIAPQPPACDKLGAGPCDANQGTYNETPGTAQHADSSGPSAGSGSGSSGSNSGSGSGSGSSGSGSGSGLGASGRGAGRGLSGPGGVGGLGLASGDGAAASGGTAAAGGEVLVVPTTLAADNSAGSTGALGLLALGLFLAAVGVPAFVHRRQSRQGAAS
jgi:ABC-type phosphate transport system substrate-binding protein